MLASLILVVTNLGDVDAVGVVVGRMRNRSAGTVGVRVVGIGQFYRVCLALPRMFSLILLATSFAW